jgi:hypothetical protein
VYENWPKYLQHAAVTYIVLQVIDFVVYGFITMVISIKSIRDTIIDCTLPAISTSVHKGHYSYGNLNDQDYQQEHCKLKTMHFITTQQAYMKT